MTTSSSRTKSSSSSSSATAVIIVFAVLCFLIVGLKAVYDYTRYTNAYEKFIQDYSVGSVRTKLIDIAKAGSSVAAIAAASMVAPTTSASTVAPSSKKKALLFSPHSEEKDASSTAAAATTKKRRKNAIEWIGGGGGDAAATPTSAKKSGANNCLFDAAVEACGLIDPKTNTSYNSQELREKCDDLLREEGFPLIPHGEPAGEQYLQALSRFLNKKVKVYKGNRDNFVAEIKHSDVPEDADSFSIVHLGSQLNGHWVAY